jgi:hypothetical protein
MNKKIVAKATLEEQQGIKQIKSADEGKTTNNLKCPYKHQICYNNLIRSQEID